MIHNAQIDMLVYDAAHGDAQALHSLEMICKCQAIADMYDRSTWRQRVAAYLDEVKVTLDPISNLESWQSLED